MPNNATYPTGSRDTLQWLVTPDESIEPVVPNNSDAALKKCTRELKQSEILLHYNYGAAAIKCWGRGVAVLQNRACSNAGPSRTAHDRSVAISEHEKPQTSHEAGAGAGN